MERDRSKEAKEVEKGMAAIRQQSKNRGVSIKPRKPLR